MTSPKPCRLYVTRSLCLVRGVRRPVVPVINSPGGLLREVSRWIVHRLDQVRRWLVADCVDRCGSSTSAVHGQQHAGHSGSEGGGEREDEGRPVADGGELGNQAEGVSNEHHAPREQADSCTGNRKLEENT